MNKISSRNLLWNFSYIVTLGLSYWFCRYAMFGFHGMKQWPTILAIVGFTILLISLLLKKKWLPLATIVGYLCGFIIALLTNSDGFDAGGGRTNNLWIIWSVIFITGIIIGIAYEILLVVKRLKN